LELRWTNEKNIISRIRAIKKEIDYLKAQAEIIERKGDDLTKVAEIKYSKIPELEKEMKKLDADLYSLQQSGRRILKEEIDEEDIAKIVSKWTGIPVTKMLESETVKLSKAESELKKQVIGQDEAIKAVANALRRSRAGISEDKKAHWFLFIRWNRPE